MSEPSISFSLGGLPTFLGSAYTIVGGNALVNIPGPPDGTVLVICGIDGSGKGALTGVQLFYNVDSIGNVYVGSAGQNVDEPELLFSLSWRGYLPVFSPHHVQVGIEVQLAGECAVAAWGLVVPTTGGPWL
jgi:hypothetical protein